MIMIDTNRHERRRLNKLRTSGYSNEEMLLASDRQAGDRLMDARGTREYIGNISEMTLWRWRQALGFPAPDLIIGRRNFWRLSSIEYWLVSHKREVA
jgi:predicted DNA-binding transcriptional regulator AlpA